MSTAQISAMVRRHYLDAQGQIAEFVSGYTAHGGSFEHHP